MNERLSMRVIQLYHEPLDTGRFQLANLKVKGFSISLYLCTMNNNINSIQLYLKAK